MQKMIDIVKKPAVAIIIENGNALLVDIDLAFSENDGKQCKLTLIDGNDLYLNSKSLLIIRGKDAHEKAKIIAKGLIDVYGTITDYNKEIRLVLQNNKF